MSKLFIISGLSGSGKDSVIEGLKKDGLDYSQVITTTTRARRENETEGNPYYFVTRDQFQKMLKQDEFFEWAEVYDNYYGNSKQAVQEALAGDRPVILRIDPQGAKTVKEKLPQAMVIFIVPPSLEVLEQRLKERGSETEETLKRRLTEAKKELETIDSWDYVVINEQGKLDEAVQKVKEIILSQMGN